MINKNERIEVIEQTMDKIKALSTWYHPAMPAWTLIQNAWGHIKSVYHLETETSIDEDTLGVKNK